MIAFISDIHGNSVALRQFIEYINNHQNVSDIYFLGDAINYYPDADIVLNMLREFEVKCILGNHELFLLNNEIISEKKNEVYQFEKSKSKISFENKEYVRSWEFSRVIEYKNKKILLVHGSPDDTQNGYLYPDTDLSKYHDIEYDVVISGHSHYSSIREESGKTFINIGSLGLPRDCGDLCSFGMFDSTSGLFEVVRLKMDLKEIISSFESEVHPSVLELLNRKKENLQTKGKIFI